MLTGAWGLMKRTAKEWKSDRVPQIGAALAYYTTVSMAPLLLVAVGVASLWFDRKAATEGILAQLTSLLGPSGAEAAAMVLGSATEGHHGLIPTIIGVVALVAGSTTVFVQMQDALNTIWDAEPPKRAGWLSMVRIRFISFAMVLATGFLLLVSLVLSAVLSAIGAGIGDAFALSGVLLRVLDISASIAVVTALFALLYKVLPDVKIAWGDVWIGALVTSVLFNVGKLAIGVYLGNSSVGSAYGAAGSLVVMLVWIYYSAQIVLFGAEFTQVYAKSHGSHAAAPVAAK
jgi:membrane protein